MGTAFLVGLAAILLVTLGNAPVKPQLTQSDFKLLPIVDRNASGASPGAPASLLSTTFTMTVPKRLKGQQVQISRVEFFSEQDAPLGTATVSEIELAGGRAFQFGTASPEAPLIPPLTQGSISFRATLRNSSSLAPGAKIYTRVKGTAGSTEFSARSRANPTKPE